jgi:hypothetical protein
MADIDGLTRDELIQLIDDMNQDWGTLNRILNTQATAFGWCSEYEERVKKYNAETKVLKMHGRFPDGTQVTVRNAYAARRLVMGHVINTLQRFGIDIPDGCWGGVVRDHRALDDAHNMLIEHLEAPTQ